LISHRLLDSLSKKFKVDCIVVDCAPSSGLFNRSVILSCDYILPCSFADQFSFNSTEQLLTYLLPLWFSWADKVRDSDFYKRFINSPEASEYSSLFLKPTNPKILPIIVQNYKKYNKCISTAFSRWINHLESLVGGIDDRWKRRNMITLKESLMVIALIPNLGQLFVISGEKSIPLPFMQVDELPSTMNGDWARKHIELAIKRLNGLIRVLDSQR